MKNDLGHIFERGFIYFIYSMQNLLLSYEDEYDDCILNNLVKVPEQLYKIIDKKNDSEDYEMKKFKDAFHNTALNDSFKNISLNNNDTINIFHHKQKNYSFDDSTDNHDESGNQKRKLNMSHNSNNINDNINLPDLIKEEDLNNLSFFHSHKDPENRITYKKNIIEGIYISYLW